MISDGISPDATKPVAPKQATPVFMGWTDDHSLLDWELSRKRLPLFQAACVLHDAVARRRPDKSGQILVLINGLHHYWQEPADSLPRLKDSIVRVAKELQRTQPSTASIGLPDLVRWARKNDVLDRRSAFAAAHWRVIQRTTRRSRKGLQHDGNPNSAAQGKADGRGSHFAKRRQVILEAARRLADDQFDGRRFLKHDGSLNGSALALQLHKDRPHFDLPEEEKWGYAYSQLELVIREHSAELLPLLRVVPEEANVLVTGD